MREPCDEKGGKVAVTITAATFLVLIVVKSPLELMPRRSSMPIRLRSVKGALVSRVAGAVKADDQAIAHQHIVAHAFEIDDILKARGGMRRVKG